MTMSLWEAVNKLALADSGRSDATVGLDIARQAQQAQVRGPPSVFSATLMPPFINHMGFVELHKTNESHGRKMNTSTKFSVKQTMRPHVVHGPTPSMLSLKPISLREVAKKVNYIHEDRIMFVKTIYACHRIVGTNLLVEDDNGDCLMLSVYNFVPVNEDPNNFFPEGTYMAILAPYMKNSGDDPSKNLLLRCDNPECIRTFDSRRSWLAAKRGKEIIDKEGMNPSLLRKLGNEAFVDGCWEKAARLNTRAIQCPNIRDDKIACCSNLAETRIRQEQWEGAEDSAKSALELDPNHKKALFRLATAQIHLNKLGEAKEIVANRPTEKEFKKLRDQIDQLLEEQEGHYDFGKMSKEAARRQGQPLATFHSDFTSPNIERGVDISKHDNFTYRGTVATKAIKGASLVSSSKALVFCPGQESSLGYSINPYTQSMLRGSTMQLESELIALMHRRPSIRAIVYSLASESEGVEDSECRGNKIDNKRVQRIVTSNTFSVPKEEEVATEWQKYKDFQRGKSPTDMHAEETMDMAMSGSGLWVNESLFNHSCAPNCTWRQIGDQIFVWTTRDVKAGEELCVAYVDINDKSFSERVSAFESWIQPGVGFSCQCDVCHCLRESDELRQLEDKVHKAYRRVTDLVSRDGVKMAVAAERVMSGAKRKAYLKTLSELPLHIQHNAGANLWVMEGTCRVHFDNNVQGARAAYEKAAEIKYAVRGGINMGRARDLWRIVGASMACSDPTKAQTVLCSIYQDIFTTFHNPNIAEAFHDLTLHYTLPWWKDSYDVSRQRALEDLISKAIKGSAGRTKSKSTKGKKSNKK